MPRPSPQLMGLLVPGCLLYAVGEVGDWAQLEQTTFQPPLAQAASLQWAVMQCLHHLGHWGQMVAAVAAAAAAAGRVLGQAAHWQLDVRAGEHMLGLDLHHLGKLQAERHVDGGSWPERGADA